MTAHTSPRLLALAVVVAIGVATANGAVRVGPPPQNVVLDGRVLVLNGQAVRQRQGRNLYQIALYLPEPMTAVEHVRQLDIPKAFRVIVLDGGDGGRTLWHAELLVAPQSADYAARLRRALEKAKQGDEILIGYVPADGTTIRLNDELIVRARGHAVMSSFIDLWLGDSPVSETMRRSLLTDPTMDYGKDTWD